MSGFRSSAASALRRLPRLSARLGLGRRRLQRRIDVLDQLDPRLLQVAVELFDVCLVEVDLGDGRGDLPVGEHAKLLALGDQDLTSSSSCSSATSIRALARLSIGRVDSARMGHSRFASS